MDFEYVEGERYDRGRTRMRWDLPFRLNVVIKSLLCRSFFESSFGFNAIVNQSVVVFRNNPERSRA